MEESRYSYEDFQTTLKGYLTGKRSSESTKRQNKSNSRRLIPEDAHHEIVEGLRERGELTRENYRSALIERATEEIKKQVRMKEFSEATVSSMISTARNIAISQGMDKRKAIERIPSLRYYDIKRKERTPVPITDKEYKSLEAVAEQRIKSSKDEQLHRALRSRAEIRAMRMLGAKPQEVVDLLYDNIDYSGQAVQIIDKDKKTRIVVGNELFFSAMKDYATNYRIYKKDKPLEGGPAFRNMKGNKISARSIRRDVALLIEKTDIAGYRKAALHAESLRDACTKELIDAGLGPKELGEKLGILEESARHTISAFKRPESKQK